MITVFVTGAGGGVGQGIIKSLKLINDLDIRIIAADMNEKSAALYTSDFSYLIPRTSDDLYIEKLISIFKKESVDYYFPGTDVELVICAKNRVLIKEKTGTDTVVSPLHAIEVSDDKYLTYQFIKENGLTAPESYLPESLPDNLKFPIIVKPRIGCRSIGVSIENSLSEVKSRLSYETGLMVQELVGTPDDEYTCTVACYEGEVSDSLVLRRVLRSGDTYQAFPTKSEIISSYIENLTKLLKINGSCNFQLRVENDIPKVFEINCRYSGTTPFCSQLGFNPVEFYLKKSLGITYTSKINYDAIVLRHWTESIVEKSQIDELCKNGYLKPVKPKISIL
jgi:carbamoyl-phosphate synthase large subunit